MSARYDLTAVRHLGGYRLWLRFADGAEGEIDVASRVCRDAGPVFEPLREEAFFAQVAVDRELGTVVWPDGADLAPDVLYDEVIATRA